jgi:hypothetical protein
MFTPIPGEWLIVLVEAVETVGAAAFARLHTSRRVKLDKNLPNWDEIQQRVEDSIRRRVPIGLLLDHDDQVVAAGWAERDFLLGIMQQETRPDWCWVYIATGGSYPLWKSHPAFSRIRTTVQNCRETRSPAWLVVQASGQGGEVVDVLVLQPEEDALLCHLSNIGWA